MGLGTSSQNWRENLKAEYYRSKMRLENAAGLLGIHSLKQSQEELAKNREAESRAVREAMWKRNGQKAEEGEEMGHMVLGDYQPQQHVHHHGMGTLGKIALAGVVATGLGGALGAAIVLPPLMKPPPVEQPQPESGTNTIEGWKVGEPIVE